MTQHLQTTITQLLVELQGGDPSKFNELFPLVYDELHALAQRQRRRGAQQTINTTALVHEAYLKMVGQVDVNWESRAHFFAIAAKAMRYILLDYAKRQQAQKRGGGQPHVSLSEQQMGLVLEEQPADNLIALDEALKKLEQRNERRSQVVVCRFFGNMTIKETAAALGVSVATVNRDWDIAQAWLFKEVEAARMNLQHPA